MLLKIKPYSKNLFPIKGIFITNKSPEFWLQQIKKMDLNINQIKIFPIPALTPNMLEGCIILPNDLDKNIDILSNQYLQLIENKLFIPTYSNLTLAITKNEWHEIFSDNLHFLHPKLGLVELEEFNDWSSLINPPEELNVIVNIPLNGVFIPSKINSYQLEIDENDWIKELATSQNEEKNIENLPFDLKKIFKGNQRELDKYLEFINKHPELALKYAIPLDLIGTNRGVKWAKYNFSGQNFFERTFEKFSLNKNLINIIPKVLIIIFGIFIIKLLLNIKYSQAFNRYNIKQTISESIPIILYSFLTVILLIGGFILLFKYINSKPKKSLNQKNKEPFIPIMVNWSNVIDKEGSKKYQPKYSFGGDEISTFKRLILGASIFGLSLYLFIPIYNNLPLFFTLITFLFYSIYFYKYISVNKDVFITDKKDYHSKSISLIIIIFFYKLIYIISLLGDKTNSLSFVILFILFIVYIFIINYVYNDSKLKSKINENRGGTIYVDNDRLQALRQKYEELAQDFLKKKQYSQAAYIYLKLLKNPYRAAEILKENKQYKYAGDIFLNICKNKTEAADCFEKGKLYLKAIPIYKELNNLEKVGDLHILINQKKIAFNYYQKVINNNNLNHQYVKASLIYKNKMDDLKSAQANLLTGWRNNYDAFNCLNNYFSNIKDENQLKDEIQNIYENETNQSNIKKFLEVLKYEYKKSHNLEEITQNIAYEIISKEQKRSKSIVSEITHFYPKSNELIKDIIKFKQFN